VSFGLVLKISCGVRKKVNIDSEPFSRSFESKYSLETSLYNWVRLGPAILDPSEFVECLVDNFPNVVVRVRLVKNSDIEVGVFVSPGERCRSSLPNCENRRGTT